MIHPLGIVFNDIAAVIGFLTDYVFRDIENVAIGNSST